MTTGATCGARREIALSGQFVLLDGLVSQQPSGLVNIPAIAVSVREGPFLKLSLHTLSFTACIPIECGESGAFVSKCDPFMSQSVNLRAEIGETLIHAAIPPSVPHEGLENTAKMQCAQVN